MSEGQTPNATLTQQLSENTLMMKKVEEHLDRVQINEVRLATLEGAVERVVAQTTEAMKLAMRSVSSGSGGYEPGAVAGDAILLRESHDTISRHLEDCAEHARAERPFAMGAIEPALENLHYLRCKHKFGRDYGRYRRETVRSAPLDDKYKQVPRPRRPGPRRPGQQQRRVSVTRRRGRTPYKTVRGRGGPYSFAKRKHPRRRPISLCRSECFKFYGNSDDEKVEKRKYYSSSRGNSLYVSKAETAFRVKYAEETLRDIMRKLWCRYQSFLELPKVHGHSPQALLKSTPRLLQCLLKSALRLL